MDKKQIGSHIWMLGGPLSFFVALVLLMIRTSHLIDRPAWLVGLSITGLIACFITYLTFKEMLEREQFFRALKTEKENQVASIRSALDETSQFYREKVEKLEEVITKIEQESHQLQVGYEQVYHTSQKEKTMASSFHTSLEDALDQLRKARHLYFLKNEHDASLPPDLPKRFQQLREQFDEKSLVLDQTRRRLFSLEGQLFIARKDRVDEKLESQVECDRLQEDLAELIGENQMLEQEIQHLEEVVAELLKPTPKKKASPKKKVEQMLDLQFLGVVSK